MQLSWDHESLDRLQLNTAIFVLACLYTSVAALSCGIPGRAKIALTASAVHLTAGFSYFLMSRNLVPLIVTPNTGRPLVVARLLEWSITVPCLLSLIGWLIDPDHNRVNQLRTRQMLCLLVGGVGPLLPFPGNWFMYAASCYLQLLVLFHMHGYFAGMKRKLRSRHDRMCIWLLHGAVLAIFLVYPIVWALAVELQWVPLGSEMKAFANLDITAKLVLTSVLSNLTAAAYDYALVDFPEYFRAFMNSVTVPAFAVDDNGVVTHWNTRMEDITGTAAGDVLYELVHKCGAFTDEGIKAVASVTEATTPVKADAKDKANHSADEQNSCPIVNLYFRVKGNPQESYEAPFYALQNVARTSSLPHVMFVEASGNAELSQVQLRDIAKHFLGKYSKNNQ